MYVCVKSSTKKWTLFQMKIKPFLLFVCIEGHNVSVSIKNQDHPQYFIMKRVEGCLTFYCKVTVKN